MKPSKLLRRFETKDSDNRNKPRVFIEERYCDYSYRVKLVEYVCGRPSNEKLLRASCEISLKTTKKRKPFATGEHVILLCVLCSAEEEVICKAERNKSPLYL